MKWDQRYVTEKLRDAVNENQIIVNKVYPDAEPLFMYSRMNGMQRKSFLQNNISFGIKGKEIRLIRGVK